MKSGNISDNGLTLYAQTVLRCAYSRSAPNDNELRFIRLGYNEQKKSELLEISKTRKYYPVIGNLFVNLDIDAEFWSDIITYYRRRNEEVVHFMDRLFKVFDEMGIKEIVLYENFGAFLLNPSELELSSSGDFDLFSTSNQKNKISEAFARFDFIKKESPGKSGSLRDTYFGKIMGDVFRVNINYILFMRNVFPINVDVSKIISWKSLDTYRGSAISIPTKEALFYLNMLRASGCYYVHKPDYRLYIDVYNCIQSDPDLDQVLRWAKSDGNLIRVAVVLAICRRVFSMKWKEQEVDVVITQADRLSGRFSKLIDLLVDSETNLLRLYPGFWRTFNIEAYSNNRNVASQALAIMFPGRNWVREHYGSDGNLLGGYLRYLRKLVGSGRI